MSRSTPTGSLVFTYPSVLPSSAPIAWSCASDSAAAISLACTFVSPVAFSSSGACSAFAFGSKLFMVLITAPWAGFCSDIKRKCSLLETSVYEVPLG